MNKLLLSLLFLFCFIVKTFASPENLWRFKVQIETKDNKTLNGYIYPSIIFGSKNYNPDQEEFIQYAKRAFANNTITIYSEIKVVKVKEVLDIDFSSDQLASKLSIDKIKSISILETLEYLVAYRLHIIENTQFERLQTTPLEIQEIYNPNFVEHCSIMLLSNTNIGSLKAHKDQIALDLAAILEATPEEPDQNARINNYLTKKKKELNKERILLFTYCEIL